jgi:NAD(P)-dependent dehydrogenase (short-subunit alcohol dehydrogenase family)
VALVTWASRGIGRYLSIELVRAGVEVYGTGRDENALDETAELCRPLGTFHPRIAEVRSEEDVERVVAEPPRLDLCINNAGIARARPFLETPVSELEEILDVNVVGVFLVMRAAAQRMVREGGGRIVTIASDAGVIAIPHMAPYCASKHAVSGLSKTLAAELGPQGVQVTTVYPGGVRTEILGPLDPDVVHSEVTDTSFGVMGVEEMAETVVATLLAAGTTVRIDELHLQGWGGRS